MKMNKTTDNFTSLTFVSRNILGCSQPVQKRKKHNLSDGIFFFASPDTCSDSLFPEISMNSLTLANKWELVTDSFCLIFLKFQLKVVTKFRTTAEPGGILNPPRRHRKSVQTPDRPNKPRTLWLGINSEPEWGSLVLVS